MVTYALRPTRIDPWGDEKYDALEDAPTALTRALKFTGNPTLTPETRAGLLAFAKSCLPANMETWEEPRYRAMRQNALRHLILTSSDWQAS
jgi:hypothetical protein